MNIFESTDKRNLKQDSDKLSNLDMLDFTTELSTSLNLEKLIFGRFSNEEINTMLEESKIFPVIVIISDILDSFYCFRFNIF